MDSILQHILAAIGQQHLLLWNVVDFTQANADDTFLALIVDAGVEAEIFGIKIKILEFNIEVLEAGCFEFSSISPVDLKNVDLEVFEAIEQEKNRQQNHLELIASENFVSKAVLEAQGSVLTNKYAEGYSGKRYYGGCEYIDQVEDIAKERLKKLFNVKYVNVQPHSGSQANMGAYR